MSTTTIEPYGPALKPFFDHVTSNLRASDQYEAAAIGISAVPSALAMISVPNSYVVFHGAEPVFVFGAVTILPGVVQLWGVGTKKTTRVLPVVTQFILDTFGPDLFRSGVRRVQVLVPLKSQRSFHWLTERLGMRVEMIMPDYCTDGSPMVQLVYTHQDYSAYVLNLGTKDTTAKASDTDAARHSG